MMLESYQYILIVTAFLMPALEAAYQERMSALKKARDNYFEYLVRTGHKCSAVHESLIQRLKTQDIETLSKRTHDCSQCPCDCVEIANELTRLVYDMMSHTPDVVKSTLSKTALYTFMVLNGKTELKSDEISSLGIEKFLDEKDLLSSGIS